MKRFLVNLLQLHGNNSYFGIPINLKKSLWDQIIRDTTYKQWNVLMLSLSLELNSFVPSLVLIA